MRVYVCVRVSKTKLFLIYSQKRLKLKNSKIFVAKTRSKIVFDD